MSEQKYYPAVRILHGTSEELKNVPRVYDRIRFKHIVHVAHPEPAVSVAQAIRNLIEHLEETLRVEEGNE